MAGSNKMSNDDRKSRVGTSTTFNNRPNKPSEVEAIVNGQSFMDAEASGSDDDSQDFNLSQSQISHLFDSSADEISQNVIHVLLDNLDSQGTQESATEEVIQRYARVEEEQKTALLAARKRKREEERDKCRRILMRGSEVEGSGGAEEADGNMEVKEEQEGRDRQQRQGNQDEQGNGEENQQQDREQEEHKEDRIALAHSMVKCLDRDRITELKSNGLSGIKGKKHQSIFLLKCGLALRALASQTVLQAHRSLRTLVSIALTIWTVEFHFSGSFDAFTKDMIQLGYSDWLDRQNGRTEPIKSCAPSTSSRRINKVMMIVNSTATDDELEQQLISQKYSFNELIDPTIPIEPRVLHPQPIQLPPEDPQLSRQYLNGLVMPLVAALMKSIGSPVPYIQAVTLFPYAPISEYYRADEYSMEESFMKVINSLVDTGVLIELKDILIHSFAHYECISCGMNSGIVQKSSLTIPQEIASLVLEGFRCDFCLSGDFNATVEVCDSKRNPSRIIFFLRPSSTPENITIDNNVYSLYSIILPITNGKLMKGVYSFTRNAPWTNPVGHRVQINALVPSPNSPQSKKTQENFTSAVSESGKQVLLSIYIRNL